MKTLSVPVATSIINELLPHALQIENISFLLSEITTKEPYQASMAATVIVLDIDAITRNGCLKAHDDHRKALGVFQSRDERRRCSPPPFGDGNINQFVVYERCSAHWQWVRSCGRHGRRFWCENFHQSRGTGVPATGAPPMRAHAASLQNCMGRGDDTPLNLGVVQSGNGPWTPTTQESHVFRCVVCQGLCTNFSKRIPPCLALPQTRRHHRTIQQAIRNRMACCCTVNWFTMPFHIAYR